MTSIIASIIIIYIMCFVIQLLIEICMESEIDTTINHQWIRIFLAPICLPIELIIIFFVILRSLSKNFLNWIKEIPAAFKELFN